MGRKNKQYVKTLHQQAHSKLVAMQAFGQSKAKAKENGTDRDKIFSFSTYETYKKHINLFVRWVQKNHPEWRFNPQPERGATEIVPLGYTLTAWLAALKTYPIIRHNLNNTKHLLWKRLRP